MNSDGVTAGDRAPGGAGLAREDLAVAWAVEETAVRVQRKLTRARTLLHRLGPARLGVSADQFDALLLGYDVYVRMLADALGEAADGFRARAGVAMGVVS